MSISTRSVHLKELLTSTARSNPKKFIAIIALGGLSAATGYWFIKKYDNKSKKNNLLEQVIPEKVILLNQVEASISEEKETTSLIMTVRLIGPYFFL